MVNDDDDDDDLFSKPFNSRQVLPTPPSPTMTSFFLTFIEEDDLYDDTDADDDDRFDGKDFVVDVRRGNGDNGNIDFRSINDDDVNDDDDSAADAECCARNGHFFSTLESFFLQPD